MSRKLTCVILAGGLGTRLSGVVTDVPKPMALVSGRPFLEYLLAQVREAGCTDVVICVGYKAQVIENHFGNGEKFDVEIRYSREQELLGTAGALAQARPLIHSDPFLVLNGDSYCHFDLQALLTQHQRHNALATIVAAEVEDGFSCGSVMLGKDNAVISFSEKDKAGKAGLVNAGIYVLNQSILDSVPHDKYCSIEYDVFPTLAGRGLYGSRQHGPFIDIGTQDSLRIAQTILPELCQRRQTNENTISDT